MTLVSNSGSGLTPATGAAYIANHVANLVAAGWTVPRWGNGTTLKTTGVPIAADLAATGAWVEAVRPDGAFAYIWQRGTSNPLWREKEAPGAFTAGSPSGTVVGSHASETIRVGGGTDASPTFTAVRGADGTYKQHTIADNASPYGAYTIGPVSGTGAESAGGGTWIHDPTTGAPSADTRPWVTATQTSTTGILAPATGAINDDANAAAKAWLGFATTASLVNVGAATRQLAVGTAAPGGVGTDSANNADDGVAIDYWRRSALAAPNGFKGVSTMLRWQGTVRTPISDIASQLTPSIIIYRISYGSVTLPALNLTHAL